MRVKFATRFDSPACLDISELEHHFEEQRVKVSALCRNDKKLLRYVFELHLDKKIDIEKSTVEVESVGRILLKLLKAEEEYWTKLTSADFLKPKNLSVGWEMQAKFDKELKSKFPVEFNAEEEVEVKEPATPSTPLAEELEDEDSEEPVKIKKKKPKNK